MSLLCAHEVTLCAGLSVCIQVYLLYSYLLYLRVFIYISVFFLQYPQMHFLNMHILYVCFTFVAVCGISAVPSDALRCVIRQ